MVASSDFSDERAEAGRSAISGANPAGEDLRSSPVFEAIEAAVRRMDTEGPGAVDWKFVVAQSLTYLREQSKDLLVAAWLCYALTRLEGFSGLAVGLKIIDGIVDEHWEGGFPPVKRERARVAALDWLIGRVTPVVADLPADRADPAAVLAAFYAVGAIEEKAGQKLQKEQLSLLDLYRLLRPLAEEARRAAAEETRRRDEEARAAEARAAAPVPTAVAVSTGGAGFPPAAVTAQPSAVAAHEDADGQWLLMMQSARTAASGLRASRYDPRGYFATRIASLLRFEAEPANEGGQCFVAPPTETAARLERLVGDSQWEAALDLAESAVADEPLWLDAHRHSHAILGAMGGAEAAQHAVVAGFGLMLHRHPALIAMRFSDGTPLADAHTRTFVGTMFGGSGPVRDDLSNALDEAKALAVAGERERALDVLARSARKSTSERDRFRAQLEQLQFCLDLGLVAAALPLAEHLSRVVAERDLERWEPDAAMRVGELTFRLLMSQDAQYLLQDDKRRNAAQTAAATVARLDLGVAARLQWS
ncbi:MAG: type VI secretion system protein TssA [Phreatobacter sp.]|uniref:type VI secretion system protein TssA n=1 Tax=Phreatobacter sp. TaxID=1966341 RepID=UPI0027364AD1|nr:type VI secretion system protein TssA [Phreatobacter sp.]MDP2800829.1 type VI secretion system protein TssA [Phreatobacter sp.]